VQADTDRLDYRVFAGPQPLDVVRRFSALVGRQPSPVAPTVRAADWPYRTGAGDGREDPRVERLRHERRYAERAAMDEIARVRAMSSQFRSRPTIRGRVTGAVVIVDPEQARLIA